MERNYDEKTLDYYNVSIYADDLKGPVCEIQLSIKVWKYSSKHCERGKMMYHVISRLRCGPALCVNINGHYWQIKAQKQCCINPVNPAELVHDNSKRRSTPISWSVTHILFKPLHSADRSILLHSYGPVNAAYYVTQSCRLPSIYLWSLAVPFPLKSTWRIIYSFEKNPHAYREQVNGDKVSLPNLCFQLFKLNYHIYAQ